MLLASVRVALRFELPIMGDGTTHVMAVDELARTGRPTTLPYPAMFFILATVTKHLVGGYYLLIPTLLGTATPLAVFVLARRLCDDHVTAIIAALFAAVHPYHMLFSSVFFIEPVLTFFILVTFNVHLLSLASGSWRDFAIAGALLGSCVAIKQIGYMMVPLVIVHHFLYRGSSRGLAVILAMMVVAAGPFLYHFYASTGTIIFPNDPYLAPSSSTFDQRAINLFRSQFQFAHLSEYMTKESILSFYNVGVYFYIRYHLNEALFLLLTTVGALHLLARNPRAFLYLANIILFYHRGLSLLKTQKYFIHLKVLVPIFIGLAVTAVARLDRRFGRYAAVLMAASIVVASLHVYMTGVASVQDRERTMCWVPSRETMDDLIRAYRWIKEHSYPDDTIADACIGEVEFYAKRKAVWVSMKGDPEFYLSLLAEDDARVKKVMDSERVRYFVVKLNFVVKGKPNTQQAIPISMFQYIKRSPLFRLAHREPGVHVYEYVPRI